MVRTRIRLLVVIVGVVVALGAVAAPAFAQENGKVHYANKASEECAKKLASGGTPDDCQKAPSPLKPENNEIIWGSLAFGAARRDVEVGRAGGAQHGAGA